MNLSLNEWQKAILPSLRMMKFDKSQARDLTVLAYLFGSDKFIDSNFHAIECSFLCAWKKWGKLPSVLVVNRITCAMREFCLEYGVDVQVESSLVGGLRCMCIDCLRNLHLRFKTEYVVIIQIDGIPVNPGIERFLGKYDYIGAPWPGPAGHKDLFPYPKYGVGNGGFCLRSKRICEQAARAYKSFWRYLPYRAGLLGDDVFYCKTMPSLSRYWRKNFRYASREEALQFSIEYLPPDMKMTVPPIGFHSEIGFQNYIKRFGIPFAKELDRE